MTLTGTNKTYNLSLTAFVKACMRNYIDDSDNISHTINEMRGFAMRIENESSEQVRMFSSTNASANKPSLVVTYTPAPSPYGAARAFTPDTSTTNNCWGYALHKTTPIKPSFYVGYEGTLSDSSARALIYNYFLDNNLVSSFRNIDTRTASISSSEWRIAYRIAKTTWFCTVAGYSQGWIISDYHFVEQINTGGWAHKEGPSSAVKLASSVTPDTYSPCWVVMGTQSITPTVYMAVS